MRSESQLKDLFQEHLPLIQKLIQFISHQQHLTPEDQDDFGSLAVLKLMENNYAALAKFKGNASLKTYLNSVIYRVYLDFRNKQWGRWRPSSKARNLGPAAILLEQLTYKEGLTLEQAIETMRTNHHFQHTAQQLSQLYAKLPVHRNSQPSGDIDLEQLQDSAINQEEHLWQKEKKQQRDQLIELLEQEKAHLSEQDRFIIHMHFVQNLTISSISRSLNLNQRQLYRRVEKILKHLAKKLKQKGLSWQQIRHYLWFFP